MMGQKIRPGAGPGLDGAGAAALLAHNIFPEAQPSSAASGAPSPVSLSLSDAALGSACAPLPTAGLHWLTHCPPHSVAAGHSWWPLV